MNRSLIAIGKLFPAIGWLHNKLRHPRLHCGPHVEITTPEALTYGRGVTIGGGSRLFLEGGRLDLADGVGLGRNVHVQTNGGHVRIGARTGVNDGARLYGNVTIGRGCAIGPNLLAASGTHAFRTSRPYLPLALQDRHEPVPDRPVILCDDCWIGINVVILPGVTIGRGAIVAANSVVRRSIAPYTVVGGAPARLIGERLRFEPPEQIEAGRLQDVPYFYGGFEQWDVPQEAYSCDAEFVLALNGIVAKSVEITLLAAVAGRISLGGQSADVSVGSNTVRLPVGDLTLPLLSFSCTRTFRIKAARLLGEAA
jgi:acetyltransferase-like isoleucine patch superfamily enzyme